MDDILIKAFEASKAGNSYAFATIIETSDKGTPRKAGSKMVVMQDGTIFGSIGGGKDEEDAKKACLKALKTEKTAILICDHFGKKDQPVCGGQTKIFIEPFSAAKNLIICGAGHIGLHLSFIGKMLGFKITVIDDRKDFACKKKFPHADRIIAGPFIKSLSKINIDKNCYIMVVTYGHKHDFECVKKVITSDAKYIGVISSKTKKQILFNELKKLGIKNSAIKKLDIPAGIDIGAQTPQEIAVSIASNIIAINNRDLMGSAKFKDKKEK